MVPGTSFAETGGSGKLVSFQGWRVAVFSAPAYQYQSRSRIASAALGSGVWTRDRFICQCQPSNTYACLCLEAFCHVVFRGRLSHVSPLAMKDCELGLFALVELSGISRGLMCIGLVTSV